MRAAPQLVCHNKLIMTNQRTPEIQFNIVNKKPELHFSTMSNIKETPKKLVSTVKHKKLNSNDYCRCCKLSLRVQYGDSWKSLSTENVFRPSKKREFKGQILAQNVEAVGIKVDKKLIC